MSWSGLWPGFGDLYLKILDNFMRVIFQERFWFAYKPFGNTIKFLSFAKFPVDHLSDPIMPSLELLL